MDKDNNNFPEDEKFKQDNTVDVLAQIKPNIIGEKRWKIYRNEIFQIQ